MSNLAFASSSGYQTISSGNHDIEVRPTGSTTDLVNAPNVNFFSQAQYTIFFTGRTQANPPNQTINPVNDDNSSPPSGNVKMRFFHASPSGPVCPPPDSASCVDIYVVAPGTDITNVSPTIPHLAYQQVTNYLSIAAAAYEIILTPVGSKSRSLDETFPAFTAGQIRTFVALDAPGGTMMSSTLLELADLN